MAIDCPPGATTKGCTSGFDPAVKGGYTYGDFPNIVGGPEVHGSGEIWGQTLWDIRTALGHNVADTLITRAMSLSPAEPSFLDMRNAIIQADLVKYGQAHTPAPVEDLRQARHGLLRRCGRRQRRQPGGGLPRCRLLPRTAHDGIVPGP